VDEVTLGTVEDGVGSFEVRTRGHKDLRETLAQRLARNGWAIRQMDLRRRKVEEHFFDVISMHDPLEDQQETDKTSQEPASVGS
jgi:hypothetical protein